MKLYTVIVSYNAVAWIEKCVGSLRRSSLQTEIVVVDNNSSDTTISMLKEQFPEVILFAETENLGFGKANNVGIQYALENNADYIFLLNQDAHVDSDCLEHLVGVAEKNRQYGIISPMQYYSQQKLDFLFENFCARYAPEMLSDNPLKPVYEISFVNAAVWLIRASCARKAGLFNPVFSHYGEDREYAARVLYHGYKLAIATDAVAYHERKQKSFLHANPSVKQETAKLYNIAVAFASDINHNYLRQLIVAKLFVGKNVLKGIAMLRFQSLFVGPKVLFKLAANSFSIAKSRKAIRKEGAFLAAP